MKTRPVEGDYVAAFEEIDKSPPRAAAILSANYVEIVVRFALAARFIPLTNDELDDHVHGPSGPLNTFAQAIELGFALGLYG